LQRFSLGLARWRIEFSQRRSLEVLEAASIEMKVKAGFARGLS
jgi:hypothetical protein